MTNPTKHIQSHDEVPKIRIIGIDPAFRKTSAIQIFESVIGNKIESIGSEIVRLDWTRKDLYSDSDACRREMASKIVTRIEEYDNGLIARIYIEGIPKIEHEDGTQCKDAMCLMAYELQRQLIDAGYNRLGFVHPTRIKNILTDNPNASKQLVADANQDNPYVVGDIPADKHNDISDAAAVAVVGGWLDLYYTDLNSLKIFPPGSELKAVFVEDKDE